MGNPLIIPADALGDTREVVISKIVSTEQKNLEK
jgi:hypothetical protein